VAEDIEHYDRFLVLRDGFPEDRVISFAQGLDLPMLADVTAQDGIDRNVVWSLAEHVMFEYLVESHLGCAAVIVRGRSAKLVREFTRPVESYFAPYSVRQLVSAIDKADSSQRRSIAVVRAGMGAPHGHVHGGIFKRVKAAILDPDPGVRTAGVWAAHYSGWPKFRPLLEQVAEETGWALYRRASFSTPGLPVIPPNPVAGPAGRTGGFAHTPVRLLGEWRK
jgi:hypothetical protein